MNGTSIVSMVVPRRRESPRKSADAHNQTKIDKHDKGEVGERACLAKRANTATLTGAPNAIPNFFKKPNGVFYIGNGTAGILETGRFLAEKPEANFATQSGPMLIIDGAIHPAFIMNSTDRKMRNGVGVTSPTEAHFVITKDRVNFYEFARYFRDGLGCRNALFLDGGVAPGLYAPEFGRNDAPGHGGYGPIIAVVD